MVGFEIGERRINDLLERPKIGTVNRISCYDRGLTKFMDIGSSFPFFFLSFRFSLFRVMVCFCSVLLKIDGNRRPASKNKTFVEQFKHCFESKVSFPMRNEMSVQTICQLSQLAT